MKDISLAWKILVSIAAMAAVFITQFKSIALSIEGLSLAATLYGIELLAFAVAVFIFLMICVLGRGVFTSIHKVYSFGDGSQRALLIVNLLAAISLILACLIVSAYQGRKLLLGNLIQYRQAHGEYLIRAQKFYDKKDFSSALLEADACIKILDRERCKDVRTALLYRAKLSSDTSKLIADNALDLDGKITMLRDYARISGDNTPLNEFKLAMGKRYEDVVLVYKEALYEALNGDTGIALNKLEIVDRQWTDFGHNHFLTQDLRRFSTIRDSLSDELLDTQHFQSNYPYFSALRRMGVEQYADVTISSSTLALRKF